MEWFREIGRFTPGRSQRLTVLLAGLLISLFAGILAFSTPVLAADATWDANGGIVRGSQTYSKVSDGSTIQKMGLKNDDQIWSTTFDPASSSAQTVKVIYFPASADLATTTTGSSKEFSLTPPDIWQSIGSTTQLSIDSSTYQSQPATGCNVPGIGWWVCGPSTILAGGMDFIFNQIATLVKSPAIDINDRGSGINVAWQIMLGIANVLFIVLFLVIIYSQITSFGVNNYGIKKILPRLVIVAIAINLSLFVCAILIDVSNILGVAVHDFLDSIYQQIIATSSAKDLPPLTWGDATAAILSGSAGALGVYLAGGATQGVLSSALVALLPILLGVFLTLVVVFIVLAARQAMIVILTIISPLGIACYLLPGTESWFKKWWNTLFTMLIFFPAFSVVFGGAQIAGFVIIQNSSSVIMLLLGMAVQVAPLAIAPLILKLGGSVLNKVAGIINDKNKGLIDRTKKWSSEQSRYLANRRNGALTDEEFKKKRFRPFRAFGRWANQTNRARDERIAKYQERADAAYEGSKRHAENDMFGRETDMLKQTIGKELDLKWNNHLQVDVKAMEKELKLRVASDQVELKTKELDNRYAEFKAGYQPFTGPMSEPMTQLMEAAKDTTQNIAVEGLRQTNAQRALNTKMADAMLRNTDLQEKAASVYEFGKDAAVASAISTMRADYAKSVEEGSQIVKHFNLSAEQRQAHAMDHDGRNSFTVTREDGTNYEFKSSGVFTREAAIDEQMVVGTVDQVSELIAASGTNLAEFRSTISAALAKSGVKGKAPFIGGKLINDIGKGSVGTREDLIQYVQEWIADGKYKPEDIAITDPQGLSLLMEAARSAPITRQADDETDSDYLRRRQRFNTKLQSGIAGLTQKAERVLDDRDLNAHVTQGAESKLEKIKRGDFSD